MPDPAVEALADALHAQYGAALCTADQGIHDYSECSAASQWDMDARNGVIAALAGYTVVPTDQAAIGAAVGTIREWLVIMAEQPCRFDQHYDLNEAPNCEQHAAEWPRGAGRCEAVQAIEAALAKDG